MTKVFAVKVVVELRQVVYGLLFENPEPGTQNPEPGTRLSVQIFEYLVNIGFDFGIEFNGLGK